MDQASLDARLAALNLGAIRFYERIGSTNTAAAEWVEQGAPDLALVVANEQTSGRGRKGRKWFTPPDTALAFSLILYPQLNQSYVLSRFTAVGALAVCDACRQNLGLDAQIKWPNDVLIQQRKICGVLSEALWSGNRLEALVVGIGINIAPEALAPATLLQHELTFPAAALEEFTEKKIDRIDLLKDILIRLLFWSGRMESQEFMRSWEKRLAFRGEWVQISTGQRPDQDHPTDSLEGEVLGLNPDGGLRLRTSSGDEVSIPAGEVRLRPLE